MNIILIHFYIIFKQKYLRHIMKKIFAIVALVMTLMISVSCGNRSAKQVGAEAEEAVELVGAAADSVVVDSTAVAPEVVAE